MKRVVAVIILILFSLGTFANSPDDVIGVWSNSKGSGHIQIYKQGGKYYGKIIWLKQPLNPAGHPKTDIRNPNAAFRNRPIIGLVMLRDFRYEDEEWIDGKIYNPDEGKEYSSVLKLKDIHTLHVRGYIGFTFIGKTDVWHRIK